MVFSTNAKPANQYQEQCTRRSELVFLKSVQVWEGLLVCTSLTSKSRLALGIAQLNSQNTELTIQIKLPGLKYRARCTWLSVTWLIYINKIPTGN